MENIERAKLIPVTGKKDTPDLNNAIDVQFNPTSLKVTLSNTLSDSSRPGSSRASQYVDKSSSSFSVELVFDTTHTENGTDVREQTKKIAEAFVHPVSVGKGKKAPKRCLFQWGAFEFLGMLESFEETIEYFSPKGRPLRAKVSLKFKEDRFEFRTGKAADEGPVPKLSFSGSGQNEEQPAAGGPPTGTQGGSPVPGSGDGPGSWRDNALFNGIETPRLPSVSTLALPSVSLSEGVGFGISGGVGIGLSAGISISASVSANISASVSASVSASASVKTGGSGQATKASGAVTASATSPAFKFGNSTALGTGVPGAFHPNPVASLKAANLQTGSAQLRAESGTTSASGAVVPAGGQGAPATVARATRVTERRQRRPSVASLRKSTPDSGVGFD